MICEKCKTPLKLKGEYIMGMFLDWFECPQCGTVDGSPKKNRAKKKSESKLPTTDLG
jgi:hypothetical protein